MIYITGANGQLGKALVEYVEINHYDYQALTRKELDLTDSVAVNHFFENRAKGIIIHCAAYTKVDDAEDEVTQCMKSNVDATHNLVNVSIKYGMKLMFISTDYVFDGTSDSIYEVDAQTNPLNVYGKSKVISEEEIKRRLFEYFIVRISWVFGDGKNFIDTLTKLISTKNNVNVVDDQIGSPTYTKDLAPLLIEIALSDQYGIYHATNEGYCSWYVLTQFIAQTMKSQCTVSPILTKDYPYKAKRPLNSKLSKASLLNHGFAQLPNWKDAVLRYLAERELK